MQSNPKYGAIRNTEQSENREQSAKIGPARDPAGLSPPFPHGDAYENLSAKTCL